MQQNIKNIISLVFVLAFLSGCSSVPIDRKSKTIYLQEKSTRDHVVPICDAKGNCNSITVPIDYVSKEISTSYSPQRKSCYLILTGAIDNVLRERFQLAYEDLIKMQCGEKYVVLNSGGGNVADAMQIGRLIRQGNLNTIFDAKSGKETTCASSCTLIFIAGAKRIAISKQIPFFESKMGFHQWSRKTSQQSRVCSDLDSYKKRLLGYASTMLPNDAAEKYVDLTIGTDCKRIDLITSKSLMDIGIATSIDVPVFD